MPGRDSATAAQALAEALDGHKDSKRSQWRCVCPVHNGRSLFVGVSRKTGKVAFNCKAGCAQGDVLAELLRLGLWTPIDQDQDARRIERPRPQPAEPPPASPVAQAVTIFRRARPLKGTLGERYLIGRDLEPSLLDESAVRFLPANGKWPPSLVELVTSFDDASQVRGLQFTPLTPGGKRDGDRRFLAGTIAKGSVIRLVADAEVERDLGLAEGTETALSVMTGQARAGRLVLPVWSTCGKANMAGLPVLPGLERLTVYGDSDGRAEAEQLAQRWVKAGLEAFTSIPANGDWNGE